MAGKPRKPLATKLAGDDHQPVEFAILKHARTITKFASLLDSHCQAL